jgi:hypothetical protein
MKNANLRLLIMIGFVFLPYTQVFSISQTILIVEDPVKQLQSLLPKGPMIPTKEIVMLMEQVGETKQLDAAITLINCLAYNFNPNAIDETKSQEEMIPAIGMLKRHFGEDVCVLLFSEGIMTEHLWMQERVALAIRYIATPQKLSLLKEAFSLDAANNVKAKDFLKLLEKPNLVVSLYNPSKEKAEDTMKSVKETPKK